MTTVTGVNSSIYADLLKTLNEMKKDEEQLKIDIQSGDKTAAAEDIQKMQGLATNITLEGHEAHFPEGSLATYSVNMMKNLYKMTKDLESGGPVHSDFNTIANDIGQMEHMILA